MSSHSTEEEVMELSLDVDSDDRVLPSDPDDYDYDYDACTDTNSVMDQEVLGISVRVQGNFTDSCSDSGNSSDGNSDDDFYMQEQHIAQNFPEKPMTLVPSPAEYDEDFYNDWTLLENGEDTGHPDGLPPFTETMATTVTGTVPMDYFDVLLRDTIWGELAVQTNAYAKKCLSQLGQDAAAHISSNLLVSTIGKQLLPMMCGHLQPTLLFWVWSTSWNLKNIGQGRHSQAPLFW